MTLSEVLPSLQQGKNIRRQTWGHTAMFRIQNNMFYFPGNDYTIRSIRFDVEDLLATDWEVVD
jgi:hypothetical protein